MKDSQGSINEIKKIFRVMYATNLEGMKFTSYQLNYVAY